VESVCQLDEQGAYVILDRAEHLAVIVYLLRLLIFLLLLLGDDTHQKRHILAERVAYVGDGIVPVVFDHIVQECGHDRIGVQHQLAHSDVGHRDRMQYVRLARLAFLILMCLAGHFKSLVQQRELLRRNPWGHGIEYSRSPLVDNLVVILVHGVVRG